MKSLFNMVPIYEIKKAFEKNAGLMTKVVDIVKKHPIYATSVIAGVPLTIAATRAVLLPYMALMQNKQLKTNESQFRIEYEQEKLLKDIAQTLKNQTPVRFPEQRRKIEPLA